MTIHSLPELLQRCREGKLTPVEREALREAVLSGTWEEGIKEDILRQFEAPVIGKGSWTAEKEEAIWSAILKALHAEPSQAARTGPSQAPVRPLYARRWAAAAAVILLAGFGYLGYRQSSGKQKWTADIGPAIPKATLTLGGGQRISLDSLPIGTRLQQGNTLVSKADRGRLAYHQDQNAGEVVQYNTLSTPRGGTYQLTLPDGSRAWLNAASSITYPTAFRGSTRDVTVEGEAYLEVARNDQQPFRVHAGSMDVVVLGTRFDVASYNDETTAYTTLLEGGVRVEAGSTQEKLKPGEQAVYNGKLELRQTDTAIAVAWKNNLFRFDQVDIPSLMRQISRWYDVDVVYDGPPGDRTFYGGIDRNLPLSNILDALEKNGIHCTLDHHTLTVHH
jgi:transmembrane sensor